MKRHMILTAALVPGILSASPSGTIPPVLSFSIGEVSFNMRKVDDTYYMGETEVTQDLYSAVMDTGIQENNGDRPASGITVEDAEAFISRLNEATGYIFSIPTEEEWIYAAAGGPLSRHYRLSGSDRARETAWFSRNSGFEAHPAASLMPNELGIHDMSGNVSELCLTSWNYPLYMGGSVYENARELRYLMTHGHTSTISEMEGLRLCLRTEGRIMITSRPGNATVYLNGSTEGIRTPYTSGRIAPGQYTVTLRREMCSDTTFTVDVAPSRTARYDVVMDSLYAFMTLETFGDSYAEIDGKAVSSGFMKIAIPEGRHSLEVSKERHRTVKKILEVKAGNDFTERIYPEAITGMFSASSTPEGAEVQVGSSYCLGKTPLTKKLYAGNYDITFIRPGYENWTGKASIPDGGNAELHADMKLASGDCAGAIFPDVNLQTMDGTWTDIRQILQEGLPVIAVLHFDASGPGRILFAELESVRSQWQGKARIAVIYIAYMPDGNRFPSDYIVLKDCSSGNRLTDCMSDTSIPQVYLIDTDGTVRKSWKGFTRQNNYISRELPKLLHDHLSESFAR